MCADTMSQFAVSDFSIGHRGACLQYPEHTLESYKAAAIQGAGIIECDVTFTSDRQLICRHAQCDLHTTTDVVTRPELNAKCSTPWETGVSPRCCASDFTLEEIQSLCAKMDSSGSIDSTTAEEYAYGGTADWRTDLFAQPDCPRVPTHAESIALIQEYDAYFTPELKSPDVAMPYEGDYTQEMYAQQMIDEYVAAGVPPERVWAQSFNPSDVYYWIENTDFGAQAVALDGEYERTNEEIDAWIAELVENNVQIVAPPMWRLVQGVPDDAVNPVEPSYYATAAKAAGLDIITWTLERTGPGLQGWYWQTTTDGDLMVGDINDGDKFTLLDVLAQEVGILGIFSDWPATVTFYANCKGLALRNEPMMSQESEPVPSVQMGSRPYWLLDQMEDSPLKTELGKCSIFCTIS